MSSKKWVVITSIYPPRSKILDFVRLGWYVVVVGDLKTDDVLWTEFASESIHYLSLSEQGVLFPEFSEQLGTGTYSRKNIGYLYAAKNGANEIFDTDDDTYIRNGAAEFFSNLDDARYFRASSDDYFNPYNFFQPSSGLWPRGYPLQKIATDRFEGKTFLEHLETEKFMQFDILQTLVNLDPDVDSIYRMTVGDGTVDFPVTNEIVLIQKPMVAPANTQSTFWKNPRKFEFLYIPRSVSFRFSDILKMYIAQHFASLAYAGFWTEQIRNPHDYMIDFESEIQCFLHTEKIVDILKTKKFENLSEVYQVLVDMGICSAEEVALATKFTQLMRDILNE